MEWHHVETSYRDGMTVEGWVRLLAGGTSYVDGVRVTETPPRGSFIDGDLIVRNQRPDQAALMSLLRTTADQMMSNA